MAELEDFPIDSPAVLSIVADTLEKNKQALVFLGTKRSAEKTAEDISKTIKGKSEQLAVLADDALSALSKPTKQCERLASCLRKGVAFHHAGLAQKQRELIEENFRNGQIKIICCTPTLAYGVDTPAYRAIIKDARRFSKHGLSWIPVLEYMQMAGRAGRPNYDSVGEAILIASTEEEKDALIERYIKGEPEEIYSKLAVEPIMRTYVLSLIAANFTTTTRQLTEFFSQTFYAYQFQDIMKIALIIEKMLSQLEEWEFILTTGREEFASAHDMHQQKLKATLLGKRVAELYIDPLTAHTFIQRMQDASDRKLHAFSLLQMISHTQEMRPLLKVRTKEYDSVQEKFMSLHSYALEPEPSLYDPEYDDYMSSIKTSLMFLDWIDEKTEEQLLEQYDVRPGELQVKLDTADWLLYAAGELGKIMQLSSIVKELSKLRFRLRYGAREELLPLLRFEGIGRVRARILYNNRIRDVGDVKQVTIATLKHLLGEKIALSLKKQVGEDIAEVSPSKRKGQVSLKKFE
jgi:helicase